MTDATKNKTDDKNAKAATAAKAKETQEQTAGGDMVVISTNHHQPRRRAGMRFTPEGVTVDASELTEAQRNAIQNDPHLVVRPIALSAD